MHHLSTKTKIILITIIAIILLSVLVIFWYLHSATLIIQVAPETAQITINGESYQNGSYHLAPNDNLEVVISANNFETKTFNLDLSTRQVTKLIIYLTPTDHTWRFYENSQNQSSLNLLLSSIGYQPWTLTQVSPNLTTDQDSSANPLIKKLSLKTITPLNFSVCGVPANRLNCDSITVTYDYYPECNNQLCLAISGRRSTLTEETLNETRQQLNDYGYNLDDYQYFYQQSSNQ